MTMVFVHYDYRSISTMIIGKLASTRGWVGHDLWIGNQGR